MQPESNEIQKDSLNSSTSDTHQKSNHGLQDSDQQPSRQLSTGEGRANLWRSASRTSSSDTSSEVSSGSRERPSRWLSASRTQGRSPVDRISDHEKALTRSAKKNRGGPAFTVVPRSSQPLSNQVNIADFPNGLRHLSTLHADTNLYRGLDSYAFPSTPLIVV